MIPIFSSFGSFDHSLNAFWACLNISFTDDFIDKRPFKAGYFINWIEKSLESGDIKPYDFLPSKGDLIEYNWDKIYEKLLVYHHYDSWKQ